MSVKPFAEQGHYVSVHDAIFDVLMPMCPPNAWKVLCLVIRKTRGWRKDEDVISYKQIREGTGISSDATVRKAIEWLTDKKMLTAITSKDLSGRQMTTRYALNRGFELTTETDTPTTESEDGFSTVSKDGPTTETVETITTEQEPLKDPVVVGVETDSSENSLPDDTTAQCLQLLLEVKGFPRDQGENAIKLAHYRADFPEADAVEVCKDFKAYVEETGKSATRLRLRNFFKQADKQPNFRRNGDHRPRGGPEPPISGNEGEKRRKEGYEWLFK